MDEVSLFQNLNFARSISPRLALPPDLELALLSPRLLFRCQGRGPQPIRLDIADVNAAMTPAAILRATGRSIERQVEYAN
jgi:hypothetical protein